MHMIKRVMLDDESINWGNQIQSIILNMTNFVGWLFNFSRIFYGDGRDFAQVIWMQDWSLNLFLFWFCAEAALKKIILRKSFHL